MYAKKGARRVTRVRLPRINFHQCGKAFWLYKNDRIIHWKNGDHGINMVLLFSVCWCSAWFSGTLRISLPKRESQGNSWVGICDIGLVTRGGWDPFTACRIWSRKRLVSLITKVLCIFNIFFIVLNRNVGLLKIHTLSYQQVDGSLKQYFLKGSIY